MAKQDEVGIRFAGIFRNRFYRMKFNVLERKNRKEKQEKERKKLVGFYIDSEEMALRM